jgi:hypothetical protein
VVDNVVEPVVGRGADLVAVNVVDLVVDVILL